MPSGGKRPGAGRKLGSKNKPKLKLTAEEIGQPCVSPPASRMRKQRDLVASLVAQDLPVDAIAVAMGLTVEKLEALFPTELKHGHAIVKAKLTAALLPGVDGGRVGAIRALDAMTNAAGQPALSKSPRGPGKKELADARALDAAAGTPFEGLLDAGNSSTRKLQ